MLAGGAAMEQQLDREAALTRVGGDLELLQEIAGLFLEDTPNLVAAIEEAAAGNDAKGLERAAHTLKGSVSNFGAANSYEAALDLEKMGRAGDFSGVPGGIERLRRALDELRPELESLAAGQ
jgi:HPt (histidine-containing phosphotransfer) domain-containing protein